jgi:methyl-accepting chemotaxis protein
MRTIGGRLAVALTIAAALVAILGVMLTAQLGSVNAAAGRIADVLLPSVRALDEIAASTARYRVAEMEYLQATTPTATTSAEAELDAQLVVFDANQGGYEKSISSPAERLVYEAFMADWATYMQQHFQAVQMATDQDADGARALMSGEAGVTFRSVQRRVSELVAQSGEAARRAREEGQVVYNRARSWAIGFLLALACLGAVFFTLFIRSVNHALRQVAHDVRLSSDDVLETARDVAASPRASTSSRKSCSALPIPATSRAAGSCT